jgi:hypothetical protein
MEIGTAVRETSVPVRGWRAWVVTETAAGLRLGSVLHDLLWHVGKPALADCRNPDRKAPLHPVPGPECDCGFYAARDPADALSYLVGRDEPSTVCRVLGEVALWGHVLETESGWRGSHAYPLRLYVPDASVAAGLVGYCMPVSSALCGSPSSPTCTATRSRSERRSPISRLRNRT